MSRFSCLGPGCEANCCNTWKIQIDKDHYDRTREAMSKTPAERQELGEKIRRVKGPTRSKNVYALIVLNGANECGFLSTVKTCSLQERYGERVLSDICAQYPRRVSISGQRLELTGSTSCPEVARQLLLHRDALELDEVEPSLHSRGMIKQTLPDHPADPYTRYHDEIRNLMLDVLDDPRFDLSIKLAMGAYFAERTRPFLHQGSKVLDEAKLQAEVARMLDPTHRAALAHEFMKISPPPSLSLRVALGFVIKMVPKSLFEPLRLDVLRSYAPDFAERGVIPNEDIDRAGEQVITRYRERKERFARFLPRIDASLTNYAKNYWVREWYFAAPDLLAHTMDLLVFLAVIRFAVLGHPLLSELREPFDENQGVQVDRALVDSVFRFSRTFEHSPNVLENMREDMRRKNMITLAHAVSLARF